MENTTKKFAVEIITQEGKWPRARVAYVNKNVMWSPSLC